MRSALLRIGFIVVELISHSAFAIHAELTVLSSQVSTFANSDCKASNSCDLKSFDIKVDQYQIKFTAPDESWTSYGTKMIASYETDKISELENYGIAQFIQGCQYISKLENGVVTRYPTIYREYMGKVIPYFHPKMVIDGHIPDPLSWGADPDLARHYFYYSKRPSYQEVQKTDYYGVTPPKDSRLYVEDHPGVASFYADSGRAYNISLKFKNCIYRSADVPKMVDPNNIDFAKPIQCFDWVSSYVYNFEKGKFENLPELDPYCELVAKRAF